METNNKRKINIEVGGEKFKTFETTLERFPGDISRNEIYLFESFLDMGKIGSFPVKYLFIAILLRWSETFKMRLSTLRQNI